MKGFSSKLRYLLALIIVLSVVFYGACQKDYSYVTTTVYQNTQANIITTSSAVQYIPPAPSSLTAEPISSRAVKLTWTDNSQNEQGFEVYRDGSLLVNLRANTESYHDSGLNPAAEYRYSVVAYNASGKSAASSCITITANPSIIVTLDRIGVYDNRENFLGGNGDVYVLAIITDGNQSIQVRLPSQEGDTYSLDKNETVSVGEVLFTSQEVGDYLSIAFVGYESDGGTFEQLAYQAMGSVLESSITTGIPTGLLEMYDFNLGSLLADFFGAEDDWLGSYECSWAKSSNWGSGSYKDLVCYDERGQACLRLWFTIVAE